uniref:Uncharacterized protein n=1 Tax=Calcidiscus leptoporus TaxID=127549 RepID=A0A7S0JJP2_9EUKA
MDGAAMHERLQAQSAWEAFWRHPNTTAGEKANASSIRAGYAAGLLPLEANSVRLVLPYFNRLHMAVRAIVQPLSSQRAPPAPPPSGWSVMGRP